MTLDAKVTLLTDDERAARGTEKILKRTKPKRNSRRGTPQKMCGKAGMSSCPTSNQGGKRDPCGGERAPCKRHLDPSELLDAPERKKEPEIYVASYTSGETDLVRIVVDKKGIKMEQRAKKSVDTTMVGHILLSKQCECFWGREGNWGGTWGKKRTV